MSSKLEIMRKAYFEADYFPALMDAFRLCAKQNLPLPAWLAAEVETSLDRLYSSNRKLRTRCERETARRERHKRRHDEVAAARLIDGTKWTDGLIYEEAAEKLGGKPDAITKSYKKVAAAIKDGREHDFYVAKYRLGPVGVKKSRKKC
jgi:hypothetical protein